MNSEKVENIFGMIWPKLQDQNWYAIEWGCAKAERLAHSECSAWAHAFWVWAVERYNGQREVDKGQEVRLFRAAWCMASWGVNSAWEHPMDWIRALSDNEFELIIDAVNRGIEPKTALWPKPRHNRKYIALMAAAQTIAHHETAKN